MYLTFSKKSTWAGLAATALLLATLAPDLQQIQAATNQDDVSTNDVSFSGINENIEIMERILKKSLQEHFAGIRADDLKALRDRLTKDVSSNAESTWQAMVALPDYYRTAITSYNSLIYNNGYVTTSTNLNLDSFYIPTTGVVYTLDLHALIKEQEKPAVTEAEIAADEKPEDNLWRQTEEEVRNPNTTAYQLLTQNLKREEAEKVFYVIDNNAFNSTINVIIKAIGKYGAKIDELSPSESIIVVAQVRGSLGSFNLSNNPIRARYRGASIPRQRLIISFPVAALQAVANGSLALEDLRDKITITLYDDSPTANNFLSGSSFFSAPVPSSGR